jgi:putative ABC transport system permease protein
MWDLLRVALRNVGRNKRRSLITAITVFIGVLVIAGTRGLLNGLQGEIRSALTQKMHGDVQLHRAGYQDSIDASPYKVMFPLDAALEQTLRETPGVVAWSARLRVLGLLNHQESQTTVPVMIQAFDSVAERRVCPRAAASVAAGRMLESGGERAAAAPARDDDLGEAQFFEAGKAAPVKAVKDTTAYHQILVTPGLFRGFNAAIGDEVVLLLQDKNNMQQAVVGRITGVLDYSLPNAQNRMIWMDAATLAKTLSLSGEVSELAISIARDTTAEAMKARLQQRVGAALVAETYLDLTGLLRDAMTLQNAIFNAIVVIVFLIVVAAIVNTSLMTVLERTREIGTIMALGYQRKHILLLFLAESAAIGLSGGLAALVVVAAGIGWLGVDGIRFVLPGQTNPTTLYPNVSVAFLAAVLALALASALLAAFLPAYKASRMRPVDALSHT